jgi:hypothetical protein
MQGVSKISSQSYSKCYFVSSVRKTFTFKGVQTIHRWRYQSISFKCYARGQEPLISSKNRDLGGAQNLLRQGVLLRILTPALQPADTHYVCIVDCKVRWARLQLRIISWHASIANRAGEANLSPALFCRTWTLAPTESGYTPSRLVRHLRKLHLFKGLQQHCSRNWTNCNEMYVRCLLNQLKYASSSEYPKICWTGRIKWD